MLHWKWKFPRSILFRENIKYGGAKKKVALFRIKLLLPLCSESISLCISLPTFRFLNEKFESGANKNGTDRVANTEQNCYMQTHWKNYVCFEFSFNRIHIQWSVARRFFFLSFSFSLTPSCAAMCLKLPRFGLVYFAFELLSHTMPYF